MSNVHRHQEPNAQDERRRAFCGVRLHRRVRLALTVRNNNMVQCQAQPLIPELNQSPYSLAVFTLTPNSELTGPVTSIIGHGNSIPQYAVDYAALIRPTRAEVSLGVHSEIDRFCPTARRQCNCRGPARAYICAVACTPPPGHGVAMTGWVRGVISF
jgi:hypothetical protein